MKGKLAFLDRWYEGTKTLARHPRATPMLAFISFIESVFFPVPTAVMLAPMIQADHSRAWRLAGIATVASVLGGVFGYLLGWFAYEAIAEPILDRLGKIEKMDEFRGMADEYGALAVFGAGLTPFPYKVITILSGALKLSFPVFLMASVLSRSMQFFLIVGIIRLFGNRAEQLMKDHFAAFTLGLFVLMGGLYWAYRTFLH